MTNIEIERRLETLEAEVAVLKRAVKSDEKPWYKQIPKFGGNPAYEEAIKLAREYRVSHNDIEDAA